ncbi:MAG: argininosuccinate lyase, partial [Amaricoccus sp.]
FTHLQPAQPVSLGHHLMAHAQALSRDISRFIDWDRRFDSAPLGAAAMAGSAFARDSEASARDLGYARPCENSIDAVASRDVVAEFLFVTAMLGVNLSRLSEEICIWATRQFAWVRLDDRYSTGSSIMPQKKNPDIAELTRGMSGTMIGGLAGMLATLKAMPLAYNRDLAEDKRNLFETIDLLELILPAFAGMVATLSFDTDRMAADAPRGFTLATEVADWLVRQGIPFSHAHEISGATVRYCEERGIELDGLTASDLPEIDAALAPEVLEVIDPARALAARTGRGGTAPARVREQLAEFRRTCATQREWADRALTGAALGKSERVQA